MIFYDPAFIVACVIAVAFYKGGREEAKSSGRDLAWIWVGLSAATSGVAIGGFQAGALAVFLSNVGLFLGIGAFRALTDRR